MDFQGWKRLKRSGHYRRKVLKRCQRNCPATTSTDKSNTDEECEKESSAGSVENEDFIYSSEHESNQSSKENIVVSDSHDEHDDKLQEFYEELKVWAIQFNISQQAVKRLLEIIDKPLPNIFPKDPRTFLSTNQNIITIPMDSGHYWHNGLKEELIVYLQNLSVIPDNISLNVNIDGLPVFKSSKLQLWPILCNIFELWTLPPIVVGIYAGESKPKDLSSFLRMFVDEISFLIKNNLEITHVDGTRKTVKVNIRALICDSPARAMIKGVCNYNGKDGCMKCTVKGEYSHTTHTVVFPKIGCPKRNDEDFRAKKYGGHHKADSPLLELPIDMVEQFVVADSLHLIDLGIMKRLLIGWRDGNFCKKHTKWCARDIDTMSKFLSRCKMPKEIHRAVRGIDVLAHWKGSEFRTFLYYLSIVILQKIMDEPSYHHFLCFFCAITICSNKDYFLYLDLADALLIFFVQNFKKYYGDGYITSNMHNLTHLVDEVRRFGILQSFSAYPFENKLYLLKRKIRQGNKPLEQIARRICEQNKIEIKSSLKNNSNLTYPFLESKLKSGPILRYETFILSLKQPDNFVLTKKNTVVKITGMKIDNNTIMIEGNRIENLVDVFDSPIKSSILNIFKCSGGDNVHTTKVTCNIYFIKCKLVWISYEAEWYFIPLLHTIN